MLHLLSMSSLVLVACIAMLIAPIASDIPMTPRIIGGQRATIKDFPYMASYHGWNFFKLWYYCGAGIIADDWLIGAAHCSPMWYNEAPVPHFYAAVGIDEKKKTFENKLEVEGYISHPQFDSWTLEHDIVLIKLAKKITFSDKVQKLTLPRKGEEYDYTGKVDKVHVAGWGMEKEKGERTDFLKSVSFDILDDSKCENDTDKVYNKTLHICAGKMDGSKDTCNGDSGSPLVVANNKGGFTILGITSYGTGGLHTCARKDRPGAYTRISYYLDWIDQTMKKNTTELFGERM